MLWLKINLGSLFSSHATKIRHKALNPQFRWRRKADAASIVSAGFIEIRQLFLSHTQDAKSIRVVKTLRVFKLGRLLKVVKLFRYVAKDQFCMTINLRPRVFVIMSLIFASKSHVWCAIGPNWKEFSNSTLSERLDISPSRMRLLKLIFILFGSVHIFSCIFWRVSMLLQAQYRWPKHDLNLLIFASETMDKQWRFYRQVKTEYQTEDQVSEWAQDKNADINVVVGRALMTKYSSTKESLNRMWIISIWRASTSFALSLLRSVLVSCSWCW